MERVLESILPIMEIEQDLIVSKQGHITIGFKCQLPESSHCQTTTVKLFTRHGSKQSKCCQSIVYFINKIGLLTALTNLILLMVIAAFCQDAVKGISTILN